MDDYQNILNKYNKLESALSDPSVLSDPQKLKTITQEYNGLKSMVEKINELNDLEKQLKENEKMLKEEKDEELKKLAEEEIKNLKSLILNLKSELEELLKPRDPKDSKDVIMEIRAGAGGDESALFAGDLFRMYSRFSEDQGWKVNLLSTNRIGIGGFKEVIFEIIRPSLAKGELTARGAGNRGVFRELKYESGVHRVQRIPETEKSGRIHTSTVTVAVLPVAEEVEIDIKPEEIKIDVFRSSGPGGQSVNTTDSAVRITHKPTSLAVSCQDEKSQLQNREKAMRILRTKLLQFEEEKRAKEEKETRRSQVGSGMRAEKIRTYNFPQDRVTDHRIKKSWHNIEKIMDGDIGGIIEEIKKAA